MAFRKGGANKLHLCIYFVSCIFHSVPATVLGMTVPICLKAGGSVQLACEVYGYPIPTVHFFKDNSSLPQDDHTHVTNSTLTITNIESRDGGVYSCSADNVVTDYSIGHALVYCSMLNWCILFNRQVMLLLPSGFPGVVFKGPDFPVPLGSRAEILCNGNGIPPPEIRWLKDGTPLVNCSGVHPLNYELVDPSTLLFTHVWTGDEGNYTCVVSNILGTNSTTLMLVIGE